MSAPKWVDRYVGKPFQWGADGPDAFDCYGLVCAVLRDQWGADCPALVGPRGHGTTQEFTAQVGASDCPWLPIAESEIRPGDVLAMSLPQETGPDDLHVAVVIAPGLMLHASLALGVQVARYDRGNLRLCRVGSPYRHRDLVERTAK